MRYDLAVIGSGGSAFAAAIATRRKGKSVVMAERGFTGGTCVNTGCVPSKALLSAAEARYAALAQRFPGIATSAGTVDLAAIVASKRSVVDELRAYRYEALADEYGWEILRGEASFAEGPALTVRFADGGNRTLEAEHYLIASGSEPWVPPIDGLDQAGYLTSTSAMELETLPESLIVTGGSYLGLEQAQLFAHLGTRVTLIEALDGLAPAEDPAIRRGIADVLAGEGIITRTSTRVMRVRRSDSGYVVTARTAGGGVEDFHAEQLLMATGRRPATYGLNLEAVGVKVGPQGEVVVDEHLRSHNPRIWAAGDVTGHPQFVYVAAAHGGIVADNALDGDDRVVDYGTLPRVTFTSPAIASVGLSDVEALDEGHDCESRVLPLAYVPRAVVNHDTRGLIKLIAEKGSGRLLGVHVLAANAGELITAGTYALASGMTIRQLADLWHPYLTMAEGLKLAAQMFTRDVAKLSCCAS